MGYSGDVRCVMVVSETRALCAYVSGTFTRTDRMQLEHVAGFNRMALLVRGHDVSKRACGRGQGTRRSY